MKKLFKGYRVIAWCMVLVMLFSNTMSNVLAAGTVSSGDISSGDSSPKVISENALNNVRAGASDDALSYYSVGETFIDAAIFCSDVHGSTSDASSVFSGIKTSGLTYSTASFGGDTFTDTNSSKSTVTSAVQSALGDTNIECLYIWGDHDSKSDIEDYTGLVYGDEEGENYYVYALSMYSVDEESNASEVATDLTTFTETVSTLDTTKPMFIVSHLPLHDRRGDNKYANDWYEVISAAAEKMDIVFFWAHNHTGETSVDTNAYYVEKDGSETMTIEGGSAVTPNFTYMNAGYINANGQNPERKGVATTVALYEDCMVFQDYNSSGTYTGTYAHNVTVDFEFADLSEEETITLSSIAVTTQPDKVEYTVGETLDTTGMIVTATYSDGSSAEVTDYKVSEVDMTAAGEKTVTVTYGEQIATFTITVKEAATESTVNTVTYIDNLLSIQATALGLSGIDAVNMWGEPDLSTYFYDYVTYDVTLEGHTEGNEVTYSMLVVDGMDTTNLQLYYIADDGSLEPIEFTLKEGYIEFTTTKVGTFTYGAAVINATLTGIEVTTLPEKLVYWVNEALDGTDLVVTASYDNGATRKLDWNEFDETVDGYALNFTTAVAGTQAVTVSYGGFEDTFEIEVYDKKVTEDTTGITVEMEIPGVTEVTADISINENVDAAVVNVMKEGTYVAYDIELVGYNDSETVTVTLPIPEGVLNPVVYYVSDDGATVTDMNATVNEDGTAVSFVTDHFSTYVVGEGTEIEVPDPEDAENVSGTVTTTTKKTIYKLVSSLTAGEEYLIVSKNSAGSGYGLAGSTSGQSVTVKAADSTSSVVYIEDKGNALEWTASSGWSFTSGNYDLGYSDALSFSTEDEWDFNNNRLSQSVRSGRKTDTYYLRCNNGTWSASTTSSNVYFYQKDEVDDVTTTTTTGTYSIVGNPAEVTATVIPNDTLVLGSTLTFVPSDGSTATTTDTSTTATYTVVDGGDPNNVISSISGNIVTFTGSTGKALVKVTYTGIVGETSYTVSNYILITAEKREYKATINITTQETVDGTTKDVVTPAGSVETVKQGTILDLSDSVITYVDGNGDTQTVTGAAIIWTVDANATITDGVMAVASDAAGKETTVTATWTDPYGNTITDTLKLNIVDAIWDLDLCEEVTTDGTTTYESITKPIVVKEVNNLISAGTNTFNLWAVISKDGESIGSLTEEQLKKLTFISSNTGIATVDQATGVVTYQGGEGTVIITAVYEYAEGQSVTDTVIFSISGGRYMLPEDGTDDFPEYPEEGSIRFDKTATAVGNFSETGIAKVELSMTGVPFTTGNELDVVVMLDQSTSMDDNRIAATVAATKAFIESIVINEDGTYNSNRVYVGYFNGGSTYDITDSANIGGDLVSIDNKTELDALFADIDDEFDGSPSTSGTQYAVALKKCYDRLKSARTDGTGDDRQQFCVFMSDGVPTTYQYGENLMHGSTSSTSEGYSEMKGMFTGTNYDTRSDDYDYEYYSTQMKSEGVTVYSVGLGLEATNNAWSGASATQCLNAASLLLNDISGSAYETELGTGSDLNKKDSYFFSVEDADAATEMANVFKNIAQKILDAAKDIKVTDKIADDYTMVFDFPNQTVEDAISNQEFYIEVIDYALTAVKDSDGNIIDYNRGTATSKLKLYLGTNTDGSYYAATSNGSTNGGNAFATPTFAKVTLGTSGTKYHWSTDSSKGDCGISVVGSDGVSYYFVSGGTGEYNMTSGAYAYGTPTTETITTIDPETNEESTETNTICNNLTIATPYFVYNASTRMLIWTAEKLSSSDLALSYFLYLEDSGGYSGSTDETPAGTYETNDYAYLNYINFNGNPCEQEFPVPQMTWNGAQVSYVFYLVNEQGQPVNRAGKVVPFSEAVYVTDTYKYSIIWNDEEEVASLEAQYLAAELVPDVYELYDGGATYDIHVFEDEVGQNLNNHFIIGAGKNTYTTYVFNTKADATKYTTPGAYAAISTYKCKEYVDGGQYTDDKGAYNIVEKSGATVVETGFDFSNTTVAFAVVWKPELVEDAVVIDYGLDVVIDVTKNDAMASGVVGVRASAPDGVTMGSGQYKAVKNVTADIKIDGLKIGTATVENLSSVRFSLDKDNGMQMSKPVTFYYESDVNYYTDTVNMTSVSMYSSVTVIPATTVYYEDSYVELEVYKDADDTLIWTDTEDDGYDVNDRIWVVEGTAVNAVQDVDRPGVSKISEAYDADNAYGRDSAYTSMSMYSMESARKLTVDSTYFGKAKFDFYGTGFDVISMTSNQTGTIVVQVADAEGNVVRNKIVDTYYGYELNADGDWGVSQNNPNALYQVPVISVEGLDYGKYSVTITVAYNDFFAHNGSTSYDFYLDAIRIYDPTGVVSGKVTNETVENAYQADGEGWPSYVELRDNIIAASNFSVTENADGTVTIVGDDLAGAIFIDSNEGTNVIADYVNYGPNNELYLASGQSIAFTIDTTLLDYIADVQLGIKVGNGGSVNYKINDDEFTVNSATDMYYSIKDYISGTITIMNNSDAILSLTNIKVTYTQNPAAIPSTTSLLWMDGESATWAVMSLRNTEPETESGTEETEPDTEETTPEETTPETEPEESEPETSEPETESGTEETEPDTEETIPEETTPETEPEESEPEQDTTESEVVNNIKNIINKITNFIGSLLSKWFR